MGQLADKARQQSKFLIIEKGGFAVVKFVSYRFIPNRQDPSVDVVQYKVNEDGRDKYWDNASGKIMRVMDKIKPGSWIKISRNSWMSKDGVEDAGKSSYMVEELDETGKVINAVLPPAANIPEGGEW